MLPFTGLTVLDLTHVFAGPFSTYQMAAMGAEVIKIESPDHPDMTRSEGPDDQENDDLMGMHFRAQGAGKKCLTLNLKTEKGQEILDKLVNKADVLVQNYTLNAAIRLGLTTERLHKINPKLIFCSVSGYGTTGPKAEHPAYDIVIQAFTGSMYANGMPGATPVRIGPAVVDYGTGAQTASAIAGALFRREKTGQGASIDVAMADCALMLMNYHTYYTLETDQSLMAVGNNDPKLAGYGAYETQDGLLMIGAYTIKQLSDLMAALDYPETAQEILQTPRSGLQARFEKDAKLLAEACLKSTAEVLEKHLNEHHVPAARVRRLDEALKEEQFKSRHVIQSVDGNHYAVTGFTYGDIAPQINTPPQELGADNAHILNALGYDNAAIEEMIANQIISKP